jgi:alpha-tubulin suppressor-like RCC1 family protein
MTPTTTLLLILLQGAPALGNTNDGDGDCYCDDEVECLTSVNSDCSTLAIGDCNDTDATRSPETPWYVDADYDGYGIPSTEYQKYSGSLSVGGTHSCAITSPSQTIDCWGSDSMGLISGVPTTDTYSFLSSGERFACVVDMNSSITCWGDDSFGQVSESPSSGWYYNVSTGKTHACAMDSMGSSAFCWGEDHTGGGSTSSAVSSANSSGTMLTALAAGGVHTCGIRSSAISDNLICWGDDTDGLITDIPGGLYDDVTLGFAHSCAAKYYGSQTTVCWGNDSNGQVSGTPSNADFIKISAGGYHTCGLTESGLVTCWGINNGSTKDHGQVTDTPSEAIYANIEAGDTSTCAITTSGAVHCWGSNTFGQSTVISSVPPVYQCDPPTGSSTAYSLLNTDCDDSIYSTNPGEIDICDNAVDESCSGLSADCGTSGIDNDDDGYEDDVDCADSAGNEHIYPGAPELCDGVWNNCNHPSWSSGSAPPAETDDDSDGFVDCAVAKSGWVGDPITGGGDCDDTDHTILDGTLYYPDADNDDFGLSWQAISSTSFSTCALSASGQIVCVGDDASGQVTNAPTGSGYVQIVSGLEHHCALHNDGSILCWGLDSDEQVSQTPTSSSWSYLDSGTLHTCALDTAGIATCWGHMSDSSLDPTDSPQTSFVTIASGYGISCGLTNTGDVECWGGDSVSASVPIGSGYTTLAVGAEFACVLDISGNIACWGSDSDFVSRTPSSSGIQALTANSNSACIVENDGAVYCWSSYFQNPQTVASAGSTINALAVSDRLICVASENGLETHCYLPNSEEVVHLLSETNRTVQLNVNSYGACRLTDMGSIECGKAASGYMDIDYTFIYPGSYCSDPGSGYALYPDDCDQTDGAVTIGDVFYPDNDRDGFGDPHGEARVACFSNIPGYVLDNTDCDDANAAISGADTTYYPDTDGDGYGDASSSGSITCSPEAGEVANNFDCDDTDNSVSLGDIFYEDKDFDQLGQAFAALSVHNYNTCAIDSVNQLHCWGSDTRNIISSIPASSNTRAVAVGESHACKLNTLGEVTCWGDDSHGQVSSAPTGIDWVALSAGNDHTCSLSSKGAIDCWGIDGGGIGDHGQVTDHPIGLYHMAISSADTYSCAITSAQAVTCWGDDTDGIITGAPSGTDFRTVATGASFACVLDSSGSLTCWGTDDVGQVSNQPTSGSFVDVALGDSYGCALNTDDVLTCWGENSYVDVESIQAYGTPVQVVAGNHHACVVNESGFVSCWGVEDGGVFDYGQVSDTPTNAGYFCGPPGQGYTDTPGDCDDDDWYAYAATDYYVDADADSYGVYFGVGMPLCFAPASGYADTNTDCNDNNDTVLGGDWYYFDDDGDGYGGYNEDAQLYCTPPSSDYVTNNDDCYDTDYDEWEPLTYFYDGDNDGVGWSATSIAVTPLQSCLTRSDGGIECWGDDTGDEYSLMAPNIPSGGPYIAVSGSTSESFGYYPFACGLDVNGAISCWGEDYFYQVSDAPAGQGFIQIVTGEYHACALHRDGGVLCWGDDIHDQVSGMPISGNYRELVASHNFTCALDDSGAIVCWGLNDDGQTTTPVSLSTAAISLGANHACALDNDGWLDCWGDDTDLQTEYPQGTDYVALTSGDRHNCALDDAGSITCWGNNDYEQLNAPVQTGWETLVAGQHFTCALSDATSTLPTGSIICWGDDTLSQIALQPYDSGYTALALGNFHACALHETGRVVCWGAGTNASENTGQAVAPAFPVGCTSPSSDYIRWPGDCDDTDDNVLTSSDTFYLDRDGDGYGDPADGGRTLCTTGAVFVEDSTDCDDWDSEETPTVKWYADADGDSYGDTSISTICERGAPSDVIDNTDCDDGDEEEHPGVTWYADSDSDGFGDSDYKSSCDRNDPSDVVNPDDCDDTEAAISPDGTEIVGDDIDQNCNDLLDCYTDNDGDGDGDSGSITTIDDSESCAPFTGVSDNAADCDDTDPSLNSGVTWYPDSDADGYGDPIGGSSCTPANADDVTDNTDCNDLDDTVYPGADEICDGKDNDCDTLTDDEDDDSVGQTTWYEDIDEDGYGDVTQMSVACTQPAGYVVDSTDCDDLDSDSYPTSTEVCDGRDNDCDNDIDDDDTSLSGAPTWYADIDGDNYGDQSVSLNACSQPAGYVENDTDCDDTDTSENPAVTWYWDQDEDGYGDPDYFRNCERDQPNDVTDYTDCDDDDDTVHPTANEVCDGLDNNCDDEIDDEDSQLDLSTGTIWYPDGDGDGFGDEGTSPVMGCDLSEGHPDGPVGLVYAENNTDCDDTNSSVSPIAVELCGNTLDENCDGWAPECNGDDSDGDGFCDAIACEDGTLPGDCDDANAAVNPWAVEICDPVDNNCNGEIDEGLSPDEDGDGYTAINACHGTANDCNDFNATVYPSAEEVCNGSDDNCDSQIDEGLVIDEDNDGWVTEGSCGNFWAYDCDDTDPDVNPDPTNQDIPDPGGNDKDDDCDGTVDNDSTTIDNDGDGYCESTTTPCTDGSLNEPPDCDDTDITIYPGAPEVHDTIDHDCDGESQPTASGDPDSEDIDKDTYSAADGDCDDDNNAVHPGMTEVCNGIDDNCDGYLPADEFDMDGDGTVTCADFDQQTWRGSPTVYAGGDCDDTNPNVWPGRAEDCSDGIDNDCDGIADNDADFDGDEVTTCEGDCNDRDATIYPGADELCNQVDDDCDGVTDEGFDSDQDGSNDCSECGFLSHPSCDCDDGDALIRPGIPEDCDDGVDNNCDGEVDNAGDDIDQDGWDVCQDCDDTNRERSPSAPERCNGLDDNCNDQVDETYDQDNDDQTTCQGDCDDTRPDVKSNAEEICDDVDNNCDGSLGPGTDDDEDGWLNMDCGGEDCDDTDPTVGPDQVEVCGDGTDNNCDSYTDTEDAECAQDTVVGEVRPGWFCGQAGLIPSGWLGLLLLLPLLLLRRRQETGARIA